MIEKYRILKSSGFAIFKKKPQAWSHYDVELLITG